MERENNTFISRVKKILLLGGSSKTQNKVPLALFSEVRRERGRAGRGEGRGGKEGSAGKASNERSRFLYYVTSELAAGGSPAAARDLEGLLAALRQWFAAALGAKAFTKEGARPRQRKLGVLGVLGGGPGGVRAAEGHLPAMYKRSDSVETGGDASASPVWTHNEGGLDLGAKG